MLNFIHIPKNGGNTILKIIIKHKLPIKYINHYIKLKKYPSNYFIVLRNPVDRFCSAVNYAITYYKNEPQIKELLKYNLCTPEKWIQSLLSQNDKYHNLVLNEICNNEHSIQNLIIPFKFTYSSQSLWIKDKPKYVLLFDNLYNELNYMCSMLYNKSIDNVYTNVSTVIDNNLSEKSKNFCKLFYKEDLDLYNFYRTQHISQRIPNKDC